MEIFWMIFGAIVGGTLGWLYDRQLKKQREARSESQPQPESGG